MPPSLRSRTAPAKVDCTRSPPKKKQACQAARDDNEAPQASEEQRLVEDNCRPYRRTELRIGDGKRAPRTVPPKRPPVPLSSRRVVGSAANGQSSRVQIARVAFARTA